MQTSKITVVKYLFLSCAFLGLLGWNAHQQNQHQHFEAKLEILESQNQGRKKRDASQSSQPIGGASYIRWGRSTCPNEESELVYAGIAGGTYYSNTGGGSEYLCLTNDVQYTSGATGAQEAAASIHGVELELSNVNLFDTRNTDPSKLHDSDVICAVCRSKRRTTQVMIPGRKECYPGWKREYWGYLMTEHWNHKSFHSFACVDEAPEAVKRGYRNDGGALMYHVQGMCGSLPCPNYVNNYELTCVVCTK